MSRRLSRISLALLILLSSNLWALGLGEIKLESALNAPLRAEIELLSATPEELSGLRVSMASSETFERYGLDRPVFLQNIQFQIRRSGRADGNVVEIRSASPITEPFVTFLVEASWARGRLLREYTVLLDPPTFAPAAATQAKPVVTAPTRSTPTDSGRIERTPPPAQPQAASPAPVRTSPPRVAPTPAPTPEPQTEAPRDPQPEIAARPYDAADGTYNVERNETLWGITSRVKPDSRLSMNQTMLAIFEANPEAFGGNINIMRAGASLRIPSADEIHQIGRGEALSEVQRQHAAWDSGYTYQAAPAPIVDEAPSQADLTLVPPDADDLGEDAAGDEFGDGTDDEALDREQEIEQRIFELENADVPVQRALIEIRDNELAALREELAQIRGEVYEPGLEDPFADNLDVEEPLPDDSEAAIDDAADDEVAEPEPAPVAQPTPRSEPGFVAKVLGALASWWMPIAGAVLVVGGLLFWFMRRGRDDEEDPESWRSLDADELRPGDLTVTENMPAPTIDESFMVVEQQSDIDDLAETIDSGLPEFSSTVALEPRSVDLDENAETGRFDSLADTFSSETAINLDQTDPIAEADFHMAYGLYDQAADLINGALGVEPKREDLLSKLCEIYFVWGNRDAFIDAAGRLKEVVSSDDNPEWDKIVIMGQQIAGDAEMFAGAGVAAATKAVDMSFESDTGGTGALDMEFGDEPSDDDDGDGLDFAFDDADDEAGAEPEEEMALEEAFAQAGPDDSGTAESAAVDFDLTAEMQAQEDVTAEMPAQDATVESPTIEQQFDGLSDTSELPSLSGTFDVSALPDDMASDATAEINLDDLGLDLSGLEETEIASLDDIDATGNLPSLSEMTGENPQVDADATGVQVALDDDATGMREALDIEALDIDSTQTNEVDTSLLDATGATQVLPKDYAVPTMTDIAADLDDDDATMLAPGYGDEDDDVSIGDDQATMLASLDDDDTDFDFAKTEALPPGAFTGNMGLDETGQQPAIASTDFDLDLDDLTAALQVSEIGDTIEQMRDDATVEQPRPSISDDDFSPTMALEQGEISDDLHDARTMTEVGTKLDLARAYVDMGDPSGARSILEEVLDEGDEGQRQQAQQLLDTLPS